MCPPQVMSDLPKVMKRPLMLKPPAQPFLWKRLPAAVEAARDAASPSLAQLLPTTSTPTTASSQPLAPGEGDSRPPPGPAEENVASFFMTQVRPDCGCSGLQGLS